MHSGPDDPRVGHRLIAGCPAENRDAAVALGSLHPFGAYFLAQSFEAAQSVLSDPRFSRRASFAGTAERLNGSMAKWGMEAVDGPGHRWIRKVTAPSMTTAAIEAVRPAITELADHLVSEMRQAGPPADIATGLAGPVAVAAASAAFGVPLPTFSQIQGWLNALVSVDDVAPDETDSAARSLALALLRAVSGAKPEPDGHGMVPRLLGKMGTDRTTRRRIAYTLVPLLVGAVENPVVSICTTLVALLSDQGLVSQLTERPELIPSAVNELLRLNPPGQMGFVRTATCDVELDGVIIPAGATVIPMIGPANRDPDVYEDADHIRLDRPAQQNLSFGWGEHSCLGSRLGMLELEVSARALLRLLPGIALAVDKGRLPVRGGHIVDGFSRVPVTWSSHLSAQLPAIKAKAP
jgi:cytochrome P450